jgi:hypothetical protein
MKLEDRIKAFVKLGKRVSAIDEAAWDAVVTSAKNHNSWFTRDTINAAFEGLSLYLDESNLRRWVNHYHLEPANPKIVAVIMAGNIPLVGFHDFLAVLISGHKIMIKLSSKDQILPTFIIRQLIEIEPRFGEAIVIQEQLKSFEAVIATGGDNSARYFHYYFGKYPNVIRKNRTSCAILKGNESDEELHSLGEDVFTYFGLGCRNVSKIFIPKNYQLPHLLSRWQRFENIANHHKYHSNYDYQKAILLVNKIHFYDSGFLLLQESEKLVSPISVLYYERYEDESEVALKIMEAKDKIQCIVGTMTPASIPFGEAQSPMPWDYADQIDTLKFLESLN